MYKFATYINARFHATEVKQVIDQVGQTLPFGKKGEQPYNVTAKDVPLMYWTAVSWAAAISLSKDNPDLIADLPIARHGLYHRLFLPYFRP